MVSAYTEKMKRGHELAKELGLRLQRLREERNLSQRQLALLAGCDAMQVFRYEKGATLPTADTLRDLATALSVSADALLFPNAVPPQPPQIRSPLLLAYVSELDSLSDEDRKVVVHVLDSIIKRRRYEAGAEEARSEATKGQRFALAQQREEEAGRARRPRMETVATSKKTAKRKRVDPVHPHEKTR